MHHGTIHQRNKSKKIKDGIFTTFMDFDVREGEFDGAFLRLKESSFYGSFCVLI